MTSSPATRSGAPTRRWTASPSIISTATGPAGQRCRADSYGTAGGASLPRSGPARSRRDPRAAPRTRRPLGRACPPDGGVGGAGHRRDAAGSREEARRGLADLLGADRLPASTCRVSTAAVAAALGLDWDGLRGLVEGLRGPLPNRAAQRSAERARREELWAWLTGEVADLGLATWAARVRAAGVPGGDVEAHRRRLAGLVAVLRALPAGGVSLAGLAADVLSDPHGLDYGSWTGSLVREALAHLRGVPPPRTAEGARELWAAFGVESDSLSPRVLVLGLRSLGRDPLAATLRAMADAAEPASITLSQIRRWPVAFGAGAGPTGIDVFVFENPVDPRRSGGWRLGR